MLRGLAGKLMLGAVGLMILSLAAGPAEAKLITFRYSGVVTSVTDYRGVFGGLVSVGDSFVGSYSFDSETPDTNPKPSSGYYQAATMEMAILIGGLELGAYGLSNRLEVHNSDALGDHLLLGAYGFISSGITVAEFGVHLADRLGSALDSDALVLTPPDLSSFSERKLLISGARIPEVGSAALEGEILAFTPEPCTAVLLACGTVLGIRRRGIKHL